MNKKYKESNYGIKAVAFLEMSIMAFVMLLIMSSSQLYQISSLFLYTASYVIASVSIGISVGLYDSTSREGVRGMIRRSILTHIGSSLIVLILSLSVDFNPISIFQMTVVAITNIALVATLRLRILNSNIKGLGLKRTLIIGTDEKSSFIRKRMRRNIDKLGIEILGYVSVNGDNPDIIENKYKVILTEGLVKYVLQNNIQQVVISSNNEKISEYMDELAACKLQGIDIVPVYEFIEKQLGAIPVDMLKPEELIYSDGFDSKHKLYKLTNWMINITLSSILVILTWPVMIITALLIKLEDGWKNPILYKQIRIGENGEEFEIYKFRSMITDAETDGAIMATKNDARVTKVGEKIRKYRIDELPQIINVLRGEMAFVGPRPERPFFVNELTKKFPYYHERHNIKPGLTGWAQLKYPYGENEADSLEKLRFDIYYVKHRSLLLDLLILMRTVEIVLFGKGR
jgi:sugar transferase (PEP-CTERM system associated)